MQISDSIIRLAGQAETALAPHFARIDHIAFANTAKVLDAFREHRVAANNFDSTSGYGYDDKGREVLDRIWADVMGAEAALVRQQIVSGTHALTVGLTTCSTIVKLLTTTAVFLLVRKPGDLLEYCLIMGGGVFINQFMLWYYARQAIGKPVFNLKRSLAHGKPMLILFIPVIAVSLYTMMDKLMLGAMSTKAQLGFYEASEKIILCASSVITAFGTVMMPRMTKLFSDGNVSESQRYMKLSVEAVMASSFAISLGILSVSRLFAPIFWGKDFASCAYILSALALSIPFSGFANVIRMQYLIPNGMDRAYIISVILGAVSNLVANSLLISIYGALGAALGTVIAEGIVCIAQCFAVRKRISLQKYLNCIVPFGVAGLIMAAAVRVIDHVAIVTIPWLLIEIFVGSIVYCSLSLLYLYYTRNELLMAGIQKFSKR